jgi:hypothetical protein
MDEFIKAVENLDDAETRKKIIGKAGEIHRVGDLFVQAAGASIDDARELIDAARVKGNIPEVLRIAHLAASAIIHGESRGRA